jgi:hypothetical protein
VLIFRWFIAFSEALLLVYIYNYLFLQVPFPLISILLLAHQMFESYCFLACFYSFLALFTFLQVYVLKHRSYHGDLSIRKGRFFLALYSHFALIEIPKSLSCYVIQGLLNQLSFCYHWALLRLYLQFISTILLLLLCFWFMIKANCNLFLRVEIF